jgi:hypothetical protein
MHTFASHDSKDLFTRLHTLFHLAICISPLVALLPRKYASLSFSRIHMIKVVPFDGVLHDQEHNNLGIKQIAQALGNIKPTALQAAEAAMWKMILRVASGSPASVEIAQFLAEYGSIVREWEGSLGAEKDRSWFCLSSTSSILSILRDVHSLAMKPIPAPHSPTSWSRLLQATPSNTFKSTQLYHIVKNSCRPTSLSSPSHNPRPRLRNWSFRVTLTSTTLQLDTPHTLRSSGSHLTLAEGSKSQIRALKPLPLRPGPW